MTSSVETYPIVFGDFIPHLIGQTTSDALYVFHFNSKRFHNNYISMIIHSRSSFVVLVGQQLQVIPLCSDSPSLSKDRISYMLVGVWDTLSLQCKLPWFFPCFCSIAHSLQIKRLCITHFQVRDFATLFGYNLTSIS